MFWVFFLLLIKIVFILFSCFLIDRYYFKALDLDDFDGKFCDQVRLTFAISAFKPNLSSNRILLFLRLSHRKNILWLMLFKNVWATTFVVTNRLILSQLHHHHQLRRRRHVIGSHLLSLLRPLSRHDPRPLLRHRKVTIWKRQRPSQTISICVNKAMDTIRIRPRVINITCACSPIYQAVYHFACPDTTLFDRNLKVCNTKSLVQC